MKTILALTAVTMLVAVAGCSTKVRVTNQNAVGPKAGNVAGGAVGAVVGNVAGAGVGFVEGSAAAVGEVFDPKTTRVVRHWRTETTADGRAIQVPVDYLVDEQGRVIKEVKPGSAF
jgi:hypothetical protein